MKAPEIHTPLPGPKAKAIIERDRKFVSPSYTRDYPFVIARGEGAVVEDVDGNRFLDCAAGIAVNSTGVSHPEVVKAIAEQAQKFIHMSGTDFYYEPQVRLAEELASIVPDRGGCPDVFRQFGNRGDRSRDQARALSHEAAGHHRVPRRVSRPVARLAVADREQGHSAPRLRSVHAWRVSRAVSRHLPRRGSADAAAAQCLSYIEDQLFTHLVVSRRSLVDRRRADPGRGRIPRCAAGVSAGAARARHEARHHARRRRGAIRHGADRQDVRLGPHRPQGATSSPSRRASRRACRSASRARAPT